MRRLEGEGLVYRIPDKGVFVKEINYEDILEITEIRTLFELHALQSCIDNVSDSELKELEQQLIHLPDDRIDDEENFYIVDRSTHKLIMSYCRNSRMLNYLKTLEAQMEKVRRVSATTPQRLPKSKAEHLEIVHAIKNRDFARASEALQLHLLNVRNSALNALRDSKFHS